MSQRAGLRPVRVAGPARKARSWPTATEPGASGPKPKPGTVGPKTVTVRVPIADARCWGRESFVTSSAARRMRSADASSESRPVASITLGAAAAIDVASGRSASPPVTTMRPCRARERARAGEPGPALGAPDAAGRQHDQPVAPARHGAARSASTASRSSDDGNNDGLSADGLITAVVPDRESQEALGVMLPDTIGNACGCRTGDRPRSRNRRARGIAP